MQDAHGVDALYDLHIILFFKVEKNLTDNSDESDYHTRYTSVVCNINSPDSTKATVTAQKKHISKHCELSKSDWMRLG